MTEIPMPETTVSAKKPPGPRGLSPEAAALARKPGRPEPRQGMFTYTGTKPTLSTAKAATSLAPAIAGGGGKGFNVDDFVMLMSQGAQAVMGEHQNHPFAKMGAMAEGQVRQSKYQDAMAKALAGEELTKEDFQYLDTDKVTAITGAKKELMESRVGRSKTLLDMLDRIETMVPGTDPQSLATKENLRAVLFKDFGISPEELSGMQGAQGEGARALALETGRIEAEMNAQLEVKKQDFEHSKQLLAMQLPVQKQTALMQALISNEGAVNPAALTMLVQEGVLPAGQLPFLSQLFMKAQNNEQLKLDATVASVLAQYIEDPSTQLQMIQNYLRSRGHDLGALVPTTDGDVSATIQNLRQGTR